MHKNKPSYPTIVLIVAIATLLHCAIALLPDCAYAQTAHFINVGQGDATLLEFPCGAALIDAGGADPDQLMWHLSDFFKRRTDLNETLDVVFVTHTHIDHNKALRQIVETYTVKNYVHNGVFEGSGRFAAKWMLEHANEEGRSVVQLAVRDAEVTSLGHKKGLTNAIIDPIDCEGINLSREGSADRDPLIRILSGPLSRNPGWSNTDFKNGNNKSLVIRVDYGGFSMLFTGDLEDVAIDTLVDYYEGTNTLDVDLYQVGHHGSDNGTTVALLKAMTPEIAVISMGKWDDGKYRDPATRKYKAKMHTTFAYGHPRKRIVELLSLAVSRPRNATTVRVAERAADFESYDLTDAVFATGWDGTLQIEMGD